MIMLSYYYLLYIQYITYYHISHSFECTVRTCET